MSELIDGLDAPAEGVEEVRPEPAAEPVVEPKVEPQAEAKEEKPEERFVPLAALKEERAKLQAKIAEEAQARKELEDHLARLERPVQEEKPPDFLDDPKGYVDSAVARIERAAKAAKEESAEVKQMREREEQLQKFVSSIQSDEATFQQKTPDYLNAIAYLREQRSSELELLYPDVPKAQILQQLAQEELALANRAFQAGRSPAELAYLYAQRRGYKTREEPKPEKSNVTPIKPEAAAVTLGAGGGGGDETPETPDDGLGEFDSALREVFGRR